MDAQPRTLDEWLDDLCVRFLVNLPTSELSGFDRIGTHVEEAHWFYSDFIRARDESLPPMSNRNFSLRLFQRFPLTANLGLDVLEKAYGTWTRYKNQIPVRGAILLNEAMDSVLLVAGYKSNSSWMFPRGKINQDEGDLDCALREVAEETGLDALDMGLIPENREKLKSFEVSSREQHIKLYVIPNVPMDYPFATRTRCEIGAIQWHKLSDLPGRSKKKSGQETTTPVNANKFYMVTPFLEQLTRWIKHQKKRERSQNIHSYSSAGQLETEDALTEEEGMATETIAEPIPIFETAEAHEAATRELHRLLNIQPPTQDTHAEAPQPRQDNGQALLAMLRQTKDNSPQVQPTNPFNNPLPHTPMDHVFNVASEPRTPHHHHPTQKLSHDGDQAPPAFSLQPDMNDQLRSVLGLMGTAPIQTMQQTTNQHVRVTAATESVTQPNLLHPQPLPRQANSILADVVMAIPSVPQNHQFSAPQQMNVPGSFAGGIQLPQQLMANLRQPPSNLDDNRLALLNAFKSESGPAKGTVAGTMQEQGPMTEAQGMGRQQPADPAHLSSPYGLGTAVGYSGNGLAAQKSPHAPASLRPQNISQNQQKALLDIFKQSMTTSPTQLGVQNASKENVASLQAPAQQTPLGHQFENGRNQPMLLKQSENLPYGAQSSGVRHHQAGRAAYDYYNQKQALQSNSHVDGLAVGGAGIENRHQPVRGSSRETLLGSPYTNQAQPGLSSSSGNLSSIPNLVPRHQEADPQQVQRLMSLFSKTSVASPNATTAHIVGKGKEPALYDSRLPQPDTHVASIASTSSMNGPGSTNSISRRGSQQAPISPENEKFLLNYLKTLSSGGK